MHRYVRIIGFVRFRRFNRHGKERTVLGHVTSVTRVCNQAIVPSNTGWPVLQPRVARKPDQLPSHWKER